MTGRDNGITALRLGLALLVVVSHAFKSGGFGADPLEALTGGQMQFGTASVIAFFGLSGWLLAPTRSQRRRAEFARRRFLRIAPGLLACVALTWIAVVPLAAAMGGTPPSAPEFASWAAQVPLPHAALPAMPGLYGRVAMPDNVNASLWTLGLEIGMYAVLWALPARRAAFGTAVVVAVPLGLLLAAHGAQSLSIALQPPVAFGAGALLSGRRVPGSLAAPAAVALAASAPLGVLAVVGPVAIPPLAIWAGAVLPLRWKADLSYGVYIYAWPVQQLLAMTGIAAAGYPVYLAACLSAVVPLAALSWRLVESPAIRLGGTGPRPVASPGVRAPGIRRAVSGETARS